MVYLKSVENVITLGKLFLKTKRNDLALPVMGTIFLVKLISGEIQAILCRLLQLYTIF